MKIAQISQSTTSPFEQQQQTKLSNIHNWDRQGEQQHRRVILRFFSLFCDVVVSFKNNFMSTTMDNTETQNFVAFFRRAKKKTTKSRFLFGNLVPFIYHNRFHFRSASVALNCRSILVRAGWIYFVVRFILGRCLT